uniref:Methyltransferase type 11 domain-containing protein n=1 Tax=Chenopodium quinoa TaxID=63459 RepID=A0A803KST7_CHEQI
MAMAEARNDDKTFTGKIKSREELNKGIADLYDESSAMWEDIWGDHMHHGYYDPSQPALLSQHRAAQIRMIEEALRFAGVTDLQVIRYSTVNIYDPSKQPKAIVDVGCGIGGSSRYLAKKFGATTQGITLSPKQAERAQALAVSEGLADKFITELARVAAPGATIIIVTWCHRDLSASEESLQPGETELLRKICDAYYLPAWCSAADYVELLQSLSLQDIKAEDWSQYVAPFWPAVIRSALTWKGVTSHCAVDGKQ